ncbi:MAG: response regulator [Acidobacteriaceae bacterium]|nr:response regulator [Acidobacteriaceae bacterium]
MIDSHKLVFLVEDNDDDRVLTMDAIRDTGVLVEIEVARDGEEALDLLFGREERNGSKWPDVVLLDIGLPKRSGLEVLAVIRSKTQTRALPVVIFTNSDEQRDVQTAYNLHANSYVRKPVAHDEFVRVVGCLGEYWTTCNETV